MESNRVARVNWQGLEFVAVPLQQLPNGDWLMRSLSHGPRITIGSEVVVKSSEVVEMAAAEMPAPNAGMAELEAGMAEERKTLISPAELIAKAPKTVESTDG